jgi:hypothetical protein
MTELLYDWVVGVLEIECVDLTWDVPARRLLSARCAEKRQKRNEPEDGEGDVDQEISSAAGDNEDTDRRHWEG